MSKRKVHKFTDDQVEWLRANRARYTIDKLTIKFNWLFDANLHPRSLANACKRRGIKAGSDGRFKKGMKTWNTGLTGYMGANKTSFKTGNLPHTYLPVGTPRLKKYSDGSCYVQIKTADPKTWTNYHHIIYERAYGPIPKGHVVIFVDGNRLNLHHKNLECVSRAVLSQLNKKRLLQMPTPVRPTVIAITKLQQMTRKIEQTHEDRS